MHGETVKINSIPQIKRAALTAGVFNEMPKAPEFQTRIAFVAVWTQITDRWLLHLKK
jgi:hypothetical protein